MIGPKASAKNGSTAVGGHNTGTIANINVGDGSNVGVHFEGGIALKLPSHLGAVIALLAQSGGLEAGPAKSRQLPPEVGEKLRYNQLSTRHPIVRDWVRHSLSLERAYHGVEQQNPDARYLVRQRAGAVYAEELLKSAANSNITETDLVEFARQHAVALVDAVTNRLFDEYCCSKSTVVEVETARLAVSLVVADAVVECEVLERPDCVASP